MCFDVVAVSCLKAVVPKDDALSTWQAQLDATQDERLRKPVEPIPNVEELEIPQLLKAKMATVSCELHSKEDAKETRGA